ncbi:MAG: hypothetical protein AAFV93_23910 [Chloroflexota bacterium]
MQDKLVVSEQKLKQFLALIEKATCKTDIEEQLNLLYRLAPEIKTSHSKLATGC